MEGSGAGGGWRGLGVAPCGHKSFDGRGEMATKIWSWWGQQEKEEEGGGHTPGSELQYLSNISKQKTVCLTLFEGLAYVKKSNYDLAARVTDSCVRCTKAFL